MELGAQIKEFRTEMAISQDELAEKVFVSRQSISKLRRRESRAKDLIRKWHLASISSV